MGSPPLGQWFPCGGKFTLKNLVTIILFYIKMRITMVLIIQIMHVNTNRVIYAGNHRRRGRFLTKSGVCFVPRHSLYPTRRVSQWGGQAWLTGDITAQGGLPRGLLALSPTETAPRGSCLHQEGRSHGLLPQVFTEHVLNTCSRRGSAFWMDKVDTTWSNRGDTRRPDKGCGELCHRSGAWNALELRRGTFRAVSWRRCRCTDR